MRNGIAWRGARSLASIFLLGAAACASRQAEPPAQRPEAEPARDCREDVGDDLEMAGRTGVAGAKTGATTAIEGVKTFGTSAAGLVEGGKDEARARWHEGAAETKATARKGASETKREANVPRCR